MIEAILAYLSSAPARLAPASRPGVVDLAAAIRDRSGNENALTRALVEQLNQRLKR